MAAVATQVVINPTPVITCPATNAEVEVALLKMQMPPIIVMMAAYNRQNVFGRFIISMYDLPDDSGSRAKQCNAYHTE